MHRTTLLGRLSSLAVFSALLAGSGCSLHHGDWGSSSLEIFGHSVGGGAGDLTVDGTHLPFNRWVDVSADLAGAEKVELGTASEPIRVNGVAGTTATLKVRLYSEIEGDGTATFEAGRLVARSQGGGKVFINAIEGSVPAAMALIAKCGTGPVEISALEGEAGLEAGSGTSSVTLRNCRTGPVKVKSGTGDIRLETVSTAMLEIDNGTGDVLVDDATATSLNIKCGTGSMTLGRCHAERATLKAGTGDTTLTACEFGELECKSGTGDLALDGGKFDRVRYENGTGDLTQRNGVIIGSLTGG